MAIDPDVQSYSRSKQGKYSPKGIYKNTKTREYFRIKPTLKIAMQTGWKLKLEDSHICQDGVHSAGELKKVTSEMVTRPSDYQSGSH